MSAGQARTGRDAGYAVIAAMVCAAAFALAAAQLTATSRNAVTTASAEAARARLDADAQAGLAMALDGLQDPDPQARWTLGGEPRTFDFDEAQLTVSVEDERGKIPLNTIMPSQARAMFQLAGAEPASLDELVAALLLRRDPDGAAAQGNGPAAPAGAETAGLTAVRDLLLLPAMTRQLYAALAPSVSVSVRDAAFEPRTATPLALQVMTAAAPGSPAVLERQRELAGEQSALDTQPPLTLAGRPLTLRVQARDARGDQLERAIVVELTRSPQHPYVERLLVADGASAP